VVNGSAAHVAWVVPNAPTARDVRTGGISDHDTRHCADRTSDDRARDRAERGIAKAFLCGGNCRRQAKYDRERNCENPGHLNLPLFAVTRYTVESDSRYFGQPSFPTRLLLGGLLQHVVVAGAPTAG
jgi:hypothetical protein